MKKTMLIIICAMLISCDNPIVIEILPSRHEGAAVSGAPTVYGIPSTGSITVNAVTIPDNPGKQTVEYAVSAASNADAAKLSWQQGTTFSGLNAAVDYYAYARSAATSGYHGYNAGTPDVSGAVCFYIINFNANGALSGSAPESRTALANDVIILPACGDLTKTGHRFESWNTQPDGSGDNYLSGDTYQVTDSTSLYALWVRSLISITSVTFNNTYGYTKPAPQTATITNNGTSTAFIAGITLDGADADVFELGGNLTPEIASNGSANFSVQLKEGLKARKYNAVAAVFFDDGEKEVTDVAADITKTAGAAVTQPVVNGSPKQNSITVNAVSLLTATEQELEYAVSTASNGTGLSAWQGGTVFTGLNGNTTYYVYARSASNANYEAGIVNVSAGITTGITVTFISNGGNVVSSQIITAGTAASRPANPSRSGYTFDYWYSDTGLTIPYYFGTLLTADITLYAKWVTNAAVAEMAAKNIVFIAGGTFIMGSPDSESGRHSGEGPQHPVTLSGFYMGKYQVTQEQYQVVMGGNPSYFTSAVAGESGTPGKLPVESVSWYNALVFCNKLSMVEGLSPAYSISGSTDPAAWGAVPTSGNAIWNAVVIVSGSNGYRLPTEAQWEYACRAGTTTAYNTGDTISDNAGWFSANSGNKTHQVGLKIANAWGIYDMHGNVWDWCWDWYGSNYYTSDLATDPVGAASGSSRVLRGGSWYNNGSDARSAYRVNYTPYYRVSDFGFRLVRP